MIEKVCEKTNLNQILTKWKFPEDVIEKYASIGIVDVFEWQAECLILNSNLGKRQNFKTKHFDKEIIICLTTLKIKILFIQRLLLLAKHL